MLTNEVAAPAQGLEEWATRIQELREQRASLVCSAFAGDALLMRPLLLHASSRSQSNRHRRVLHIEYAASSSVAEPLQLAIA